MAADVRSATIAGLDGHIVIVEADMAAGLPRFDIVGLPDATVKEAKERTHAAIKNSAFDFPAAKTVVNLAPADLKKEGTQFDLPIAIAILKTSRQLVADTSEYAFLGELALSGELRSVSGVLPSVTAARDAGFKKVIVPLENTLEAALVDGIEVYGARSLTAVVCHLTGAQMLERTIGNTEQLFGELCEYAVDFAEVKGQARVKRGIEIAAAGGHNCLIIGSPGSGKTMLAQRIPTILPDMTMDEAIEVTKIYSVAGELEAGKPIVATRPFRAPHHSASAVSLVGGGTKARPGEISLAHNGVLFLDELPEYRKDVLESMRQPLEDGRVTVTRAAASYTYPCSVMLVAAMNPCRCGYYGDPSGRCRCSESDVARYLHKISGPMLDRIDIQLEAPTVKFDDLNAPPGETSAQIRERVNRVRKLQHERYKDEKINCNAQLSGKLIEKYCPIGENEQKMLKSAFDTLSLSVRAYTRILKVARTIADLAGREDIDMMDLSEAVAYRNLDRKYWK